MGRHRKHVTNKGNLKHPSEYGDREHAIDAVDDRLGLNDSVCTSCDTRNPADAEKCRKCDCTQLRPRASGYRDE